MESSGVRPQQRLKKITSVFRRNSTSPKPTLSVETAAVTQLCSNISYLPEPPTHAQGRRTSIHASLPPHSARSVKTVAESSHSGEEIMDNSRTSTGGGVGLAREKMSKSLAVQRPHPQPQPQLDNQIVARQSSSGTASGLPKLETQCETKRASSLEDSPPRFAAAPRYISYDQFSEAVCEARVTKNYDGIRDFLGDVFGSLQEIDKTFRTPMAEEEVFKPGIDLEYLDFLYETLVRLPIDVQKITLRSIVNCLLKDSNKPKSHSDLRAMVILLLNPLFTGASTYVIYAHLLRQFSILANDEQHTVINWLRRLPVKDFKAILSRTKQFVSVRLFPTNNDLPALDKCVWWIPTAAKFLALCNAANWLLYPPLVAHTAFYITAIEHLELGQEFQHWQSGGGGFSFCQYPFLLSLLAKRFMIQKDSEMKMLAEARQSLMRQMRMKATPSVGLLFLTLRVRRNNLLEDSLNEIARNKADLRKKLRVHFMGEQGLDLGGLSKEWFFLIMQKLFNEDYGMFTYNKKNRVWWFSSASKSNNQEFNLIGVLMGLALYNGINLDIRFPPCCYKKLLNPAVVPYGNPHLPVGVTQLGLEDLKDVAPDLAKGLQELLDYDGNVEEDLCQSFQISFTEFGQTITRQLKPQGATVSVTKDNREEYVRLYVDYLLNKSIYQQFYSFYHGFHSVCASNALILLRPEEVEMMVCGNPEFDLAELEKVTQYDGYSRGDQAIRYFWESLKQYDLRLKRRFLMFCTGSDRVPLGGLKEMEFKITRMVGAKVLDMLPMAHTCFNQLCLPPYKTRKAMKAKLTIAISNSEGFGIE